MPGLDGLELQTLLREREIHLPLLTPKIGEVVYLDDENQVFEKWWEAVPAR